MVTPKIVDADEQQMTDNASPSSFSAAGIFAGVGQMIPETGPIAVSLRSIGRAFKAMEHVDYRYMWCGALFSNIGMWMQTVAVQWLVKSIALDSSALWLGRTAFFQQVPTALMLPIGGLLADRFDRRWIILTGNACLSLLAVLLALIQWQGKMNLWILMGAVMILGVWQALLKPSNQSLLSTLVSKDNLPNAIALNSMQHNLTRGIGPAIGGVILVWFGAQWSFGINALTYFGIIVAVLMIQKPEPASQKKKKEGLIKSLAGGGLYLKHRHDLQLLLFIVLTSGFLATPLLFMLPAIVETMYDNKAQQFSNLLSSFGFGAVAGVIMLAMRSHRKTSPWRGFLTLGVLAMVELAFSFSWPFYVAMGLMFIAGMSYISSLNRFFAGTIGTVPNHVRGRVTSIYMLCMMIGYPTGSIAAGSIATAYGIPFLLRLYGVALLVILGFAGLLIMTMKLHVLDESDH